MAGSHSEAALLADLAQLKLEQGDAQGAEELFRQCLEQQQDTQQGGAEGAVDDAYDWEAWDEASVPVAPAPPQPKAAAAVDSWETAAAAATPPPRRPDRTGSATRAAQAAAAPQGGSGSGGEEEEAELQYGGGHVLEFHGLTPAVKTQHLEAFLERHAVGHKAPPTLRWVDDHHAAVACTDPLAARQLLAAAAAAGGAAEFRLRGYADAGSGTRRLAASELLPPKPRPKTTAAVARRLIGGALNLKLRDRDAEQELSAARRQQRQQRQERQQALDAAWDG